MKNELLKNKIIDSIASKTVSDNLIFLSIAIIKHNNYLIDKKEQSKYLFKAAVDNGISKDNIGRKVNSITVESYTNCISLRQALKISGICNNGDYIYDKNYLPDAVCGFVSDDELLKEMGFLPEDDALGCSDNEKYTDKTKDNMLTNTVGMPDTALPSSPVQHDSRSKTITTLEIAEMMEIEHKEILKKLEGTKKPDGSIKQVGIIPVLTKGNFPLSDYFIPSTYKDASGKSNKCYLVTKLGCDFLANKFTGEKGILFTAKYVKRFDEMEKKLEYKIPQTYKEALLETIRLLDENEKKQKEIEQKDSEIYQKDEELSYKSNVIDGLVKDVGLADKRQIINRIVRHQGGNYNKRWRILYREFNNKFHIDIERQMKSYNKRVEGGKKYKRKIDFIDRYLHQLDDLYDIAVKIFEYDYNMLVKEMYYINNNNNRLLDMYEGGD